MGLLASVQVMHMDQDRDQCEESGKLVGPLPAPAHAQGPEQLLNTNLRDQSTRRCVVDQEPSGGVRS